MKLTKAAAGIGLVYALSTLVFAVAAAMAMTDLTDLNDDCGNRRLTDRGVR
jgi:hypothetical protein